MQAGRYIKINKHLTGEPLYIQKFLPWTKGGKDIVMANNGVNSKVENIRDHWYFTNTN